MSITEHLEATVIGHEVNLAARIEARSLRGQVLLGENAPPAGAGFHPRGRAKPGPAQGQA